MERAVDCYSIAKDFPSNEIHGMISQIRRSAPSVAANIAESHGRENTGSFIQFLRMSKGSLKELETHLTISGRVGLLPEVDMERLFGRAEEIGKMLRSMVRSLQQK